MNLAPKQVDLLNDAALKLNTFKDTWISDVYDLLPHQFILLATGNQFQKTASTAHQIVKRILGIHPVPKKNVTYYECETRAMWHRKEIDTEELLLTHCNPDLYSHHHKLTMKFMQQRDWATWNIKQLPKYLKCPECGKNIIMHKRDSKVIRFASETQPGQFDGKKQGDEAGESREVKNTQYPEFKKWLPRMLILKDITARNFAMTIRDIQDPKNNITVELVSYNQSVQSTAGSQKVICWMDEEPKERFLEEQKPRLLMEDGDLIITNTPANSLTYLYDSVFERASVYIRTKTISDKFGIKQIETTGSPFDIAVIQGATDDNPVLTKEVVEHLFSSEDDPDRLLIRRYGIFKQVSGRIFKSFDWKTHVIDGEQYFPEGIPLTMYNHYRMIDYHEHNNWACVDVSISPENEAFVWMEYNPSPETMKTYDMARQFGKMTSEYKFALNLIDPLAAKKQTNTGLTCIDDLNRYFSAFNSEGWCKSAYWQSWDTKATKGRDAVRERLMNAIKVGKPFNNRVIEKGITKYIPTLWVFSSCQHTAKSLKNWRLEEWANNQSNTTKDMKEQPQQKWSHFCTAIECLFKHPMARPPIARQEVKHRNYNYFKGDNRYAN